MAKSKSAKDLKRTMLNRGMRDKIINHANMTIDCPNEREAEESLRLKLIEALQAYYMIPEADFQVLARYNAIQRSDTFTIWEPHGEGEGQRPKPSRHSQVRIVFRTGIRDYTKRDTRWDQEGVVEGTTVEIAHSRSAPAEIHDNPQLWGRAHRWNEAKTAHTAARKEAIGAITSLANQSKWLDEVVAIWPPAVNAIAASERVQTYDEIKKKIDKTATKGVGVEQIRDPYSDR